MADKDKKEEKITDTNIFVQLLDQNYANKLEKVIEYCLNCINYNKAISAQHIIKITH